MVQVKWLSIILSIFLPNPSESLQVQSAKAPKRSLTFLRSSAPPEVQDTSSTAKESSESDEDPVSESDVSALTALAGNTAQCLILSDLKRKGGGDGSSTGWTSWVEEKSAFKLQCCVDLMSLSLPEHPTDTTGLNEELSSRDETQGWIKWMKGTPVPLMIDLSTELRDVMDKLVIDEDLLKIETTREELFERIGLRLITLPSGKALQDTIRTPPGAMVYGKLLYGGAKRYRILPGKARRKTGERTAIKTRESESVRAWLQYGGPERNYEAVDMGPCGVMELVILPKGLRMTSIFEEGDHMAISNLGWKLDDMLTFFDADSDSDQSLQNDPNDDDPMLSLSGDARNNFIEESFTKRVGGLQTQIQSIVRRVLDGRVFRAFNEDGELDDQVGLQSWKEARELEALGLTSVKGLLLYGKPGTGKTLLAREISNALRSREPKIVSAPELLDRWVGGSEKLIRALFIDAENELKDCNGDASKSSLHVIVIDEIDAVFRKRSASDDSAQVTRASAVNQILAKLDGVEALPNVLLIGMTNRKELLDEALLRPGRLEVQVEIPLPDTEGRREILKIHFEGLRRKGRLSQPLCRAIDGMNSQQSLSDVSLKTNIKSMIFRRVTLNIGKIGDLAAESVTGGFSGADLAGLVRCAGSIALSRTRIQGSGLDSLLITLEDVTEALKEVQA